MTAKNFYDNKPMGMLARKKNIELINRELEMIGEKRAEKFIALAFLEGLVLNHDDLEIKTKALDYWYSLINKAD